MNDMRMAEIGDRVRTIEEVQIDQDFFDPGLTGTIVGESWTRGRRPRRRLVITLDIHPERQGTLAQRALEIIEQE